MKNNIHVLRLALGSRRKIKQIPNLVGDDYITFLNMGQTRPLFTSFSQRNDKHSIGNI